MEIKIVKRSNHELTKYSINQSAGMDISSRLDEEVNFRPLKRKLIPTGLYEEIPEGYEDQILPRSGLDLNKGVSVLNSPGTLDSGYRGEVFVIFINLSDKDFIIRDDDRICQMIIAKLEKTDWIDVEILRKTDGGSGEFGHTGKE